MAVVKEWMCLGHGAFESKDDPPLCPFGCDTVERAFLTPVGFRSEGTANIDRTVQSLARSHGLSDISNRGGLAAIRQPSAQANREQEFRQFIHDRYGDGWGAIPKGGTMNAKTGVIEGSGPGPSVAIARYGARPDNVLEEVRPALVPKPVLIRRDHENLKVPA